MINTTILSGCDKIICMNLDIVSIMIGMGLGMMCFYLVAKKHLKRKKQEDEK